MDAFKLGKKQQQFANLIWQHAPIGSRALSELCEDALGWKRTTTYTMLKGLCEKGLFENRDGTVVALMSREDLGTAQAGAILKESFDSSLPHFLAAFTHRNTLSDEDIAALQQLIDQHKEG